MISERTVLERLAEPDPQGSQNLSVDVHRLRRSVLNHLRQMLNTRCGHAPAQPDYGIPDLNEFMYGYPESVTPMRMALQASIEKYEPRLRNVKVHWAPDDDDPLNVRFAISAVMVTGDDAVRVSFATSASKASGLGIDDA